MRAIGPLCLCGCDRRRCGSPAAASGAGPAARAGAADRPAGDSASRRSGVGRRHTVLVHRVRRHAQRRRGRRSGRRADRPGGAQPRGRPDDRAHSRERVDAVPDPFRPAIGRRGAARSERRDVERQLLADHRADHARSKHSVLLLGRQSRRDDDAAWRSGPRAGIAQHADGDVETDSAGGIAAATERLSRRTRSAMATRSSSRSTRTSPTTRSSWRGCPISSSTSIARGSGTWSRSFITRSSPRDRTAARRPIPVPGTGRKAPDRVEPQTIAIRDPCTCRCSASTTSGC